MGRTTAGYLPDDWKPRVTILYATDGKGSREAKLKIGGRHIALPDGTVIEPMQAIMPIDDLDALIAGLERVRDWCREGPAPAPSTFS